jgi:N-acyl-D-aspartate/D-glutamate deacylase
MRGNYLGKAWVVAGAIAEADITVFDPERIIDKATYEEPLQYSEGIQFVLVNGAAVVKEGRFVDGVFPGRAARAPIS